MVDIMDMEDIFYEILKKYFVGAFRRRRMVTKKLIREVESFVDAQKNIACNNCKGYKFSKLKEACEVL